MIKIELTPEDAKLFVLFRKYQDQIKILVDHDVFTIRNGKATLHFNKDGRLASVDASLLIFRK